MERPTLKIRDIAMLKQHPREYYDKQLQTTKTHDGTSSGPITSNIKKFQQKYGRSMYRVAEVYDENGKLLDSANDLTNEDHDEIQIYDSAKLKELGTNNHVVYKPTSEDNANHTIAEIHENEFFYTPSSDDMEKLMFTNADGESLVKSITLISPGECRMSTTIIKNNNYSSENDEDLMVAGEKLEKTVYAYDNEKSEIMQNHRNEWENSIGAENNIYVDENGVRRNVVNHPDYKKVKAEGEKLAEEQLGSIPAYLEANGVYDDFEKANAKLKIRRNDDVDYNHRRGYDEDDYISEWEEAYDKPFYGEYEPYDE